MKRDELFEELVPRRGGLARMRKRLDEPARKPRGYVVLAFGAAALLILLLLVRKHADVPDLVAEARAHGDVSSIELGLAPALGASVMLEPSTTMAMVEVTTSDPKVAFYWVSSTAWASKP